MYVLANLGFSELYFLSFSDLNVKYKIQIVYLLIKVTYLITVPFFSALNFHQ